MSTSVAAMSTSSSEPTGKAGSEQPGRGHPQPPATGSSLTTTTPCSTFSERVEARRRDPEFQKRLKQNLERHQKVLELLADS